MRLKNYPIIAIIFTVVLITTTYKNRVLIKYVKVSTADNKFLFKVLKIERR